MSRGTESEQGPDQDLEFWRSAFNQAAEERNILRRDLKAQAREFENVKASQMLRIEGEFARVKHELEQQLDEEKVTCETLRAEIKKRSDNYLDLKNRYSSFCRENSSYHENYSTKDLESMASGLALTIRLLDDTWRTYRDTPAAHVYKREQNRTMEVLAKVEGAMAMRALIERDRANGAAKQ